MYITRQQDTTRVGSDSMNFARAMYHVGVAVWQFEYDFHPTKRVFIADGYSAVPWHCDFREGLTWGPFYSGLSLFALRSVIPDQLNELLGAQNNLSFHRLVSWAVRLHDQSMAIGQASGDCVATVLNRHIQPRDIPWDRTCLIAVQLAIASPHGDGPPGMLWPTHDLELSDPSFTAVNMLSVQGCLPLQADAVEFHADRSLTQSWMQGVVQATREQMRALDRDPPLDAAMRGKFTRRWWRKSLAGPWKQCRRESATDADGIADRDDTLPLDPHNPSLPVASLPPDADSLK